MYEYYNDYNPQGLKNVYCIRLGADSFSKLINEIREKELRDDFHLLI